MKITITPTTKLVELNGVQARIWEGAFEGHTVHFFITRVAVPKSAPAAVQAEFEQRLLEQNAPTADVAAYPSRLAL